MIIEMRDLSSDSVEYEECYQKFLTLIDKAAKFLDLAFYVSTIHLFFPLNQILETYFLAVTNRKASEIGANFYNELLLCSNMGLWIYF